eukprot:SAG11_NODE_2366_length_3456_cov_1.596068_3_plen_90_part_00
MQRGKRSWHWRTQEAVGCASGHVRAHLHKVVHVFAEPNGALTPVDLKVVLVAAPPAAVMLACHVLVVHALVCDEKESALNFRQLKFLAA